MPQPRQDPPALFQPLRPARGPQRRLALLLGSALWLVALVVLALVVSRRDAVELALAVVAGSFVLGVAVSCSMRVARVREERDA